MTDLDHNIKRFMRLFRSNERSYGAFFREGKAATIKGKPIPQEAFRAHLDGTIGLGAVPIMDDGKCWWAAIDFDVHGPRGRNFDLIELGAKIQKHQFPLVLCRSKSGGAHGYVFFTEPTPATVVRPLLTRWAAILGWRDVEIFPKQVQLVPDAGDPDSGLGNWLNLPYYKASSTNRYCIEGGKQATLDYFLEIAEGRRYKVDATKAGPDKDYENGPPCLQEMLKQQVDEGGRNVAVFQAAVFLKRSRPEDWKERTAEFNALTLTKPLAYKELRQITGSVQRKDYNYKCREEPCRSLCNREVCRTREFGITDADTKANELPPFDKIEKVIATPIRWVLHIKGKSIELSTQQLFDFNAVRQAVYEKLNLLLPRMKSEEWDVHLREVAERARTRHETTIEDLIFTKLCDFLRRANQDRAMPEEDRRAALTRRMPALISISDTKFKPKGQVDEKGRIDEIGRVWFYAFRAQDFIDHMRRHKALIVQEHQVHTLLHRLLEAEEEGASQRDKFRVGQRTLRNVWLVPEVMVEEETVTSKEFKAEF